MTHLQILQQIPDNAVIAKEYHTYILPKANQAVKSHRELIEVLGKEDNGPSEDMLDLINELSVIADKNQDVIDAFLTEWPAPNRIEIKDAIKPIDEVDATIEQLLATPVSQSLPDIPLTFIVLSRETGTLYYINEQTGDLFKVPNIWYNRPNTRERVIWAY